MFVKHVGRRITPIYTLGSADARIFGKGQPTEYVVEVPSFWTRLWRKFFSKKQVTPLDFSGVVPLPSKTEMVTYSSISATDIKFYAELQNGERVCMPEVQGISINECLDVSGCCNCNSATPSPYLVHGQICCIVFKEDPFKALPSPIKAIELKAVNEYGRGAICRFEGVEIDCKDWGVTIDDIVLEMNIHFKAKSTTSWQQLNSNVLT